MWRILQHSEPDDFVLATGEMHSVREFCEVAFKHVGVTIAYASRWRPGGVWGGCMLPHSGHGG